VVPKSRRPQRSLRFFRSAQASPHEQRHAERDEYTAQVGRGMAPCPIVFPLAVPVAIAFSRF